MEESSLFVKQLHQKFNRVFIDEDVDKYKLAAYVDYIHATFSDRKYEVIGELSNMKFVKQLLFLKDFIKHRAQFIVISLIVKSGDSYVRYIVSYLGILKKELNDFDMDEKLLISIYLDFSSINYIGETVYITAQQIAGQLYYLIKEQLFHDKSVRLVNCNGNKMTLKQKINLNELLHLSSIKVR